MREPEKGNPVKRRRATNGSSREQSGTSEKKRWPQKNPFLVGELDELQQIATVPHPPVRLWPR